MHCRFLIQLSLTVTLFVSTHAAIPNGLVHHWNFDEGPDWHDSPFGSVCTNTMANDSVGGVNAALQNMGPSNWVSGRQFTALELNGINQYLTVATNLAGSLGGTASLSFWLRTTQTGAASAATAPGISGVAGSGGAQWGWLDDAGRIGLAVDNTLIVRSTNAVSDGQWHHVVITRDSGTGAGQVYVDGVLHGSATGASGLRSAAFTSMGRIENGGSPKYFTGRLDQVHVFNRVITGAEVATLGANHAPKCWNITTEGVNSRPFTTASIFARTFDVERDPVTVTSWTQPAHGAVTYNGDGSFTYTATGGYLGGDSFAVTVGDGQGGFHTADLKVTVMSESPGGGGVPVTQFADFAALQANGVDMSHSGWRVPRVIDWDNDGRLDLLIGAGGYVWRYMNIGTTSAPVFAAGVKVQAAGADIYAGTGSSPIALMDMTGDGVKDLVLADSASKLRVYRNTAASNAAPVYAASTFVKNVSGTDFVLADRRFDLGDWDGDGKPDLVTGTYSGNIQLFLNTGTAADPRFSTGTTLFSDSYQIYPRLFDLNGNGLTDLLRGINWGSIVYWRDAGSRGLVNSSTLSITGTNGASPDLHALTDGAMVDFGDFNGDGKPDLLVGGHASDKIFLAYGVQKTIAQSLAEIEAIYNVDTNNVGVTLSANTNALLAAVNNANLNIISHLQNGTLGTREALFNGLTNHIAKYAFLKYQTLNTTNFHHVPSIVLQNWVMLEYALADTPTQRTNIANVMGLVGTMRTIFLETGLALGDNGMSLEATYGTIRDFQRRHPRELFPDAVLTTDQLYSDGRGGFIWTPNSTKNTFGQWALGNGNEWAGDLTAAIEKVIGAGAASGDYFTFVMGHEVTHSLDGYVNSRANADLRKRWGLMLCTAAGPDVIPGANGWWDWTATKTNFQAKGYWDGNEANWNTAWSNYWAVGYGSQFKNLSFMRFDISWFMGAPQESLATQANHHWANACGRLIGATDRFRRATTTGLPPLQANINEVATFIDYQSAGMNRVNLFDTKNPSKSQVIWNDHYADLERDDRGYIRRIKVEGQNYDFESDTNGVVTNVNCSVTFLNPDALIGVSNVTQSVDVTANDTRLDGKPVLVESFTQPAHGTVTNGAGLLWYKPATGYSGMDSFTYQSGTSTTTVMVVVPGANQAPWTGGGPDDNWSQAGNWFDTTPTNGRALMFLGSQRLNNTNNLLTASGQVSFLNGGFALNGNPLTLQGGFLNLAGDNIWAINTTLGSAQSCVCSNGTLTISGAVTNAGYNLTVDGTGATTLAGLITGSGGLTKNGAATLTISAGNNYSGATVINGGKLLATGGGWYANRSIGSGALTVNSGATVEFTKSHGFGIGPSGKSATINGGTLKLDGDNYLSGLTLTGGTLDSSGNYVAPQSSTFTVNPSANPSILSVVDFRMQGAVTFNVANGAAAVDLALSGLVSGGYGFTKSGEGLMQFAASSTYNGITTIGAGTLQVDGSLGTNSVAIASGATLSGLGTAPGAVTVQNGGTLSPGSGGIGTLTTGGETWNGGAKLVFELNSATGDAGHDRLNINDSLNIQATAGNKFVIKVITLTSGGAPGPLADFNKSANAVWTLVSADGGVLNFDAAKFLVDTSAFANDFSGGTFGVRIQANSLVLNYFAPPAPPVIVPGGVNISGGNFNFQFAGTIGQNYRVEYTPTLPAPGVWGTVTDIVSLTTSPFVISVPMTNGAGFYRVGLVN